MSTYKPWFLAHAKNEHIIFPDEISAVSGTYYVTHQVPGVYLKGYMSGP